jgi:2-haloacid dehalogenase
MSAVTRQLLADRVPERMEDLLDDFEAHRLEEAIGPYKRYDQLINDALRRTAVKWGSSTATPTRGRLRGCADLGPHPDVPEALTMLASRYPLVILSNASADQSESNVEKLGAPFHAVYTAQQRRRTRRGSMPSST